MEDKNVCPKCGQIYDAALGKCPLCGAASPSAPQTQSEPAPAASKGGKYLSRKDKKDLRREEERFLREEEGRYARMKRRGDADTDEGEDSPIPTGFIVSSVIILIAALLLGGSFLLWKANVLKLGIYDRLSGKTPTETQALVYVSTDDAPAPTVSTEPAVSATEAVQTDAPTTESTAPEVILPDYDPELVILVNDEHPIPSDYAVGELTTLRGGAKVSDRCLDDLQKMFDDCRAAQHYPDAYFGYDEFDSDTSEYRTGLALDIYTDNGPDPDVEEMRESETLIWLAEHCYEYGFILRNPEGKEASTGHGYEPWHFRYVGKAVAEYMHENDLCLEEFAELLG